jgi:cytochrome P450
VYADPAGRFWALSRYADVQAAARDWETFSSAQGNDLDQTALLFAPAGELTHAIRRSTRGCATRSSGNSA